MKNRHRVQAPLAEHEREEWLAAQRRQVLDEEREWMGVAPGEPLAALCLSGGGIRSATYSLGVLQGLARKGLLGRFHYLSTVSGGGYIGSWLQAWIARQDGDVDRVVGELADSAKDDEPAPVRRLRAYTSYLNPVWGFSTDTLVLVATFLRNLVLNWLVLIPLVLAVLIVPHIQLALVQLEGSGGAGYLVLFYGLLAAALALLLRAIAYSVADLPLDGAARVGRPPPDEFGRACLLPLVVAAVLLSWLIAWDGQRLANLPVFGIPAPVFFFVAGGLVHMAGLRLGIVWRRRRGLPPLARRSGTDALAFGSGGLAGLMFWGYLAVARNMAADPVLFATWSMPLLMLIVWAGCTLYVAFTSRRRDEEQREWLARAVAWGLAVALGWLFAAALVFHAPAVVLRFSGGAVNPFEAGVGAALMGAAASAYGFFSKAGSKIKEHTQGFLEFTGMKLMQLLALLFVLAFLVTMGMVASWGVEAAVAQGRNLSAHALLPVAVPLALAAGLFGAALLASHFVGVNTFSLHSMYGNRLARAYLGASNTSGQPHWFTGFDPHDNLKMTEGRRRAPGQHRLLHVVNAAVNMVKPAGGRLQWQQRMAASFIMTPLYCGSDALGYARTGVYGARGGMSWARAMAISGAAASPSMGYHTSRMVAFVMTLFNARLGWWSPNPTPEKQRHWRRNEPGTGVMPLVNELLASVSTEHSFVHLSDGGHFENLGLYEMVRRKCRRILVVDASCDPEGLFEDLEGAIRKVRVDFGATISFKGELPTAQAAVKGKSCVLVGTIHYRGDKPGEEGEIVYIKPALCGDEPVDIARFASANAAKGKAFPHQPTSDQFFNESQFESYRALGQHAVERHFTTSWENWLASAPVAAAPIPNRIATRPPQLLQRTRQGLQALLDQVKQR